MITLAGCKAPRVTNFCMVHNASLRTLARSCSGSAVPLYLACGAVGRVRCDISSKSSASSMNVTVPGSSAQTSWRVQDKRSAKKGSSQGQVLDVGLASVSVPKFSVRGTGPISCWYRYPVRLTCLVEGNSMGACSSRILRAARMATYMCVCVCVLGWGGAGRLQPSGRMCKGLDGCRPPAVGAVCR